MQRRFLAAVVIMFFICFLGVLFMELLDVFTSDSCVARTYVKWPKVKGNNVYPGS